MIFLKWNLVCLKILYQFPDFYPQGDPLWASPGFKTNYIIYKYENF